jgi:hypothetical protein
MEKELKMEEKKEEREVLDSIVVDEVKIDIAELRAKMMKEYLYWETFIISERTQRREWHKSILNLPDNPSKIKGRMIYRQISNFQAMHVKTELEINAIPMWGFNAMSIAENYNKVRAFAYQRNGEYFTSLDYKTDIASLWLWVKAITGWDETTNDPIITRIDPLSIVVDPDNMRDSKNFLWIHRKMDRNMLLNSPDYFNVSDDTKSFISDIETLNEIARATGTRQNTQLTGLDEWWDVWVYDHYMTFGDAKYLTTWASTEWMSSLVRIVKIKPKSETEKKYRWKIKMPYVLTRSEYLPWRVFWPSLIEKNLQYQDIHTLLTNAQIINAIELSMWAKVAYNPQYMDQKGIDNQEVGTKYIPMKKINDTSIKPDDIFYPMPVPVQSEVPEMMKNMLTKEAEETSPYWTSIGLWVSPDGNQTKWEINTLQKNLNLLISFNSDLMMMSEQEFEELIYSNYLACFPWSAKKRIVMKKWGLFDSYDMKKKDFLVDDEMIIQLVDQAQENIKRKEKFTNMMMLIQFMTPTMKPWSYQYNNFMRDLGINAGIESNKVFSYIPYTISEVKSLEGLEILNAKEIPKNALELLAPQPWDDLQTFIDIYKMAKDSE